MTDGALEGGEGFMIVVNCGDPITLGALVSRARFGEIDERRRAIIRVLEAALTRRKAASKENELARKNKDESSVRRLAVFPSSD